MLRGSFPGGWEWVEFPWIFLSLCACGSARPLPPRHRAPGASCTRMEANLAKPLPGAGEDILGRVLSPDPSPDPALPRDKSPRGGFARRRAQVGWGHYPVASPRPHPKWPQGCSRAEPHRIPPWGHGRGSIGVPEPPSAAHGGESGRDDIPGQPGEPGGPGKPSPTSPEPWESAGAVGLWGR